MDETKKHLYRIDPMKVQQKIYSLYPANSTVRKTMVKEEKIREYSILSRAVSSFPMQVAEQLAENSKTTIKYSILKGVLFGGMAIGLFYFLSRSTTVLEFFLLSFLGFAALFMSLLRFLDVAKFLYSMYEFKTSFKQVQNRINKLKKDILE